MNRTAATSLNDADLVVLVIDATKWTAEDDLALERVVASGLPAIAAVNKIDQVHPRDKLLPYMADLAKRHTFADIVPISALKSDGVEALKKTIAAAFAGGAGDVCGRSTDREQPGIPDRGNDPRKADPGAQSGSALRSGG